MQEVRMDQDRIRRWKCLCCGTTRKKMLMSKNMNGQMIGYGLLCCNCGHVEQFAMTLGCATAALGGNNNYISKVDVKCALTLDDMRLCNSNSCPYRPIPPEERSVQQPVKSELEPTPRNNELTGIKRIYK